MTHHYSKNLVKKILLPLGIALFFILIVGILAFQNQYRNGISNLANERMKSIEGQFYEELNHNSKILRGLIALWQHENWIGEHLSSQNREVLLNYSQIRFQQLRDILNISHLYFSDSQRINILRVHNPLRFGDTIDRYTTKMAQQTGKVFLGLELGPYGTYTLRAVAPWQYRQNNVGYVELGIDTNRIINEIASQSETGLLLFISKSALTRPKWEEGQRLNGQQPDWDKYQDVVISSRHGFSGTQLSAIPDLAAIDNPGNNFGLLQELDNKLFVWRIINIRDIQGQNLGKLYLAINITDWVLDYKQTTLLALIIYLIISSILIISLYKLAQRTQIAETELQQTKDQFESLATYDQLVGLPNRQLFKQELLKRIQEAGRFDQMIAVAFIDLDNFKTINDTLGHDQGDLLIKIASDKIARLIRKYDVLARFGGDEFVLMMPNIDSESDVVNILDKITQEMAIPLQLDNDTAYATISAGVSIYPGDGNSVDDLLHNADIAMYEAKEAGRNCYRFFTRTTNELLIRRQMIENMLREAIKNNELELYYQPVLNLSTNKIAAYEALLRWFPNMSSPPTTEELIAIAERSSLIIEIGNWVIEQTSQQINRCKQEGMPCTRINVNIACRQLMQLDIYELILSNLKKYNLSCADIGLELAEKVLINANDTLIENLQKLIDEGVAISIDDFGTGYSSLSYLRKFPVSTVKIDKQFVGNAHNDANDQAIIHAIVAMGHSLGLTVVAEGVETKAQYELIREAGCDFAQGFYLQKPVAAADISSDPLASAS